ncbi:lipoprotein [uncultured Piscinibacter sp.]|uniref:LPS translocon maturation chaperone LptM n=1 Tax=uncultured Piscinibacter sp. TaxID=1131835 RepID=UPI002636F05F|nr:lipoprotein [uncultured Piscinibacter sp.]
MRQCNTSVSATRVRHPTRRHRGLVVIAAAVVLAGLAACGQKGPLIAPQPAPAASAAAAK